MNPENAAPHFIIFQGGVIMKFLPKGLTAGNLASGAGVVLLAPVVIPVIGTITKPLIKSLIKGALITYEGAKVTLAEARESLEDITAEAKAEVGGDTAAKE
jgi:hypothetical protein